MEAKAAAFKPKLQHLDKSIKPAIGIAGELSE
jgi:hypothetical protein